MFNLSLLTTLEFRELVTSQIPFSSARFKNSILLRIDSLNLPPTCVISTQSHHSTTSRRETFFLFIVLAVLVLFSRVLICLFYMWDLALDKHNNSFSRTVLCVYVAVVLVLITQCECPSVVLLFAYAVLISQVETILNGFFQGFYSFNLLFQLHFFLCYQQDTRASIDNSIIAMQMGLSQQINK